MIFCVFILISKIILNRIITLRLNTQQHHRLKHLISRLLYIFISYLKKEGRHSLVNGHKNDKILNFFLWDEWQRLFYRSIYHSSNFHFYLPSFSHIFGLSEKREKLIAINFCQEVSKPIIQFSICISNFALMKNGKYSFFRIIHWNCIMIQMKSQIHRKTKLVLYILYILFF